jgi:hypothetical protein
VEHVVLRFAQDDNVWWWGRGDKFVGHEVLRFAQDDKCELWYVVPACDLGASVTTVTGRVSHSVDHGIS